MIPNASKSAGISRMKNPAALYICQEASYDDEIEGVPVMNSEKYSNSSRMTESEAQLFVQIQLESLR